ncbi:P-loop containing nucleoside triphosphate hydrolase protein [Penicillium taxi]|uniref:P-loop containing nucleoside triphosphate hydrolase protein n=1 Tax=Penicillium taxi TaxID=168475 RepID=UPI00254541F6|nr:P-loop containing nucleoside triphosphate hydrolase protein [Penicillium taxi]KAJ5909248.1 P-loop containing nucleoside triphosphate hydrolase protein [Penicillium taxi]
MIHHWENQVNPEKRHALLLTTLRSTLGENLWAIPFILVSIGLKYAQPTLISSLIRYVSDPLSKELRQQEAVRLILTTILIYVGLAVFKGRRETAERRVAIATKGSLMGILHEKTLNSDNDGHSVITLASSDVEDLQRAMKWVHVIWSSFLSMCLGLYLLTSKLGWVSIVPLFMLIATSQAGNWVSKHFTGKQKAWSEATQNRVDLVTILLEHLQTIKMMGYSSVMEIKVQTARESELKAGVATYWLDIILIFCGKESFLVQISPFALKDYLLATFLNALGPVITLGIYAVYAKLTNHPPLDTDRAFTSFALIQMVTQPANSIMFILPELLTAMTAFDRVQNFLTRLVHQNSRELCQDAIKPHSHDNQLYRDLLTDNADNAGNAETYAISIQNATVQYKEAEIPVLKDISMNIKPGWLTLLTGPTGSGKTSLARLIIGEGRLQSGKISILNDKVAYCAQCPWLRNGTIRDIIAGPPGSKVTDEKWYKQVIFACDLASDFQNLPNGDNTQVGDRGISISGGQRQRLALARAVYSKLDIMVLDDVFSALDIRTATCIMHRLFGLDGLLRQLNKTIILVTNSTHILQDSDWIVILNSDGSMREQGTWHQPQIQALYQSLEIHRGARTIENWDEVEPEDKFLSVCQTKTAPSRPESLDPFRKNGDSAVYNHYISAIGGYRLLSAILIFLSSAIFAILIQSWLRIWTESNTASQHIWFYLRVYVALAIGHWVSLTGIGTMPLLVVPTSGRALHSQILNTVIKAPLSFITSADIGTTLSRFTQDIKQIDRQLPGQIAALGSQVFKLLAQLILLYMAQSYNLITFPLLILAVYLIQKVYLCTSRQLRFLSMEANSLPNNSFVETVQGIATIRAFGWEREYALDNNRAFDESQVPSYTLLTIEQWLSLVLDLIIAAVALFNVAFIVTLKGGETAGDVGISMNVLLTVNIVLMITVQTWASFDASLGVISRIRTFATTVTPESEPEEEASLPDMWPTRGEVEFNNVTADYTGTGELTHAINHISFQVAPGDKIGLCGRTGSGKSSTLLSLLRMIELSDGTITIDGLDTVFIPREKVRSQIITIPQDAFIIPSDSIRQNLDLLGVTSDDDIVEALKKVHLWPILEARVSNIGLSPGLYLDVQMQEWPLSHGQSQLFALARALLLRLSRGKLVLLDEATSSIDKETEVLIQQVIREEFRQYTMIVVAHRPETISQSDSIIVMENGRIVEQGSPDLLRQKGRSFKSIFGIKN